VPTVLVLIIAVTYVSAYNTHIWGLHQRRVPGCFHRIAAADILHAPMHCDGTSLFTGFEKAHGSVGKAALHHYRSICCRLCPAFFAATWYHRSTLHSFCNQIYRAISSSYVAVTVLTMPVPPTRGHHPSTCFPNISLLNFRGEGIMWYNKPYGWQRSVAAQTVNSEVLQSRNSVLWTVELW